MDPISYPPVTPLGLVNFALADDPPHFLAHSRESVDDLGREPEPHQTKSICSPEPTTRSILSGPLSGNRQNSNIWLVFDLSSLCSSFPLPPTHHPYPDCLQGFGWLADYSLQLPLKGEGGEGPRRILGASAKRLHLRANHLFSFENFQVKCEGSTSRDPHRSVLPVLP